VFVLPLSAVVRHTTDNDKAGVVLFEQRLPFFYIT